MISYCSTWSMLSPSKPVICPILAHTRADWSRNDVLMRRRIGI
ncbi:hypothetical protein F-S17_0243 [Faustovirus]|nr:hypothetical protein F-LCD7_0252 [Faustovirus]QJX72509.1 hypothetical protein F-S17_0243 [Faustovirus]QJX74021.1 hypothetical protein F-E9_267 [Faustovirus]